MTNETAVVKPPKYYTEPDKIEVGGISVAYRRKGSGEPLLFLHGAGLTRMWLPFYEELSKSFDVIAPEHPGFGETPFPEWLRGFDDLVQHYDQFLEELDLGNVHLVGFSIGGWTAAEFATFYPRRLKSLTLINPMGLRVDWPCEDDMFAIGPEGVADRIFGTDEARAEYLYEPSLDEVIHSYGEASTAARLAWTPRYNTKLNRRLERVSCPSLVLLGENDRLIPDSIGKLYAELLPNSSVDSIKGSSHAVFCDDPVGSAKVINEFIEGIS